MKNDDVVLIQRILAGDETAFASLVRKYQKQVHTLAWRKIRDFHIAEDITQETFLQAYQKLETLEDPTRFPRWLYVIADRLCIAWLRKNQRQTEPLEEADLSGIETEAYSRFVATEHAEIFAEARRDLVEKLLAKLKENNRTVITLHYLEGMTYAEIVNFLGVPENTIRSRLRRARQQLKKYEFMIQDALDITIEVEHHSQKHLNGDFGMKLTFERDNLLSSLQVLQGVASEQNTPPIPSNVLIHAEGSTIECMATDTEIGIRMKVDGTVKEAGTILIPAGKLADIVKAWPTEKPIDLITTTNNRIEITSGNGIHKTVKLADEEFPQLPSIDEAAFAIDGETLRSVLHKTEFAAPTKKARQACLNGLYFNLLEDRTEIVATDAIQLALAHCEPLKLSQDSDGFIVPLKAVKEIERTFANSPKIRISRIENQILFADERTTVTTRLVDAEYPPYEKLIPVSPVVRAVVPKASIVHAMDRILSRANPEHSRVCLEIDEQQIRVSAETPESEEMHETLAVESSTGSIRIGINAQLLIETLLHIRTGAVSLEFSGVLEPVIVKPIGEEDHLCVIMPMSLES
ncbi:MAG: DNA polymerase III subunit beta [Candidatus Poribacteria bacterium]|nr:DNA polymerase III subunit beta [Candidatus Poribacteria bacterium]